MPLNDGYFHSLLSSIPDAVFVHAVDTHKAAESFIVVNEAACRLLNYPRDELLRMTPTDVYAPDSGVDRSAIMQALSAGRNMLFEQICITGDGQRIPVEVNSRLCMLDEYPVIVSLVRDISTRRMLEGVPEQSRHLADNSREAIFFVKPDAGFAYVNEAACRYLGYSAQELLSLSVFDIAPQVPRQAWPEYLHHALSTAAFMYQAAHRTKDGRIIPVEITTHPIRFAGQVCFSAHVRDISERVATIQTLQESERKYRELVEHANSIILRMDREGRITFLNEFGQQFFGYSPDEIIGHHAVGTIVPPSESTGRDLRPLLEDICTHPKKYEHNVNENMRKNGARVWIDWTNKAIMDEQGQLAEILSIGSDITARREAEKKMKHLSTAVEQSSDWILITDNNGGIEYVNDSVVRMTGYAREEMLGQTPRIFKSGKHDQKFYREMWDAILSGQTFSGVLTNRKKTGELFDIYHVVTPIRDDTGRISHFVATSKDITIRRQMEERINFLANYDSLTELPNRNLFTDRLIQAVSRVEHSEKSAAVLFIDIDRFHFINEALGLQIGDACLMEISQRLPRVVREGDIVARFGNDEFGVALIDLGKSEDVILILKNIQDILSRPIRTEGGDVVLNYSIGISIYPDDNENIKAVLHNADIACQKAGEQGGNSYQFFTPDMNAKASEFILMERNLLNALKKNQMTVHYQPYFDIRTCKMAGMEALLRWQPASTVTVSPMHFIPVLEKTGMIIEVGEWVLRNTARQIRKWQDEGYPAVPVSVNLSPVQFHQHNLVGSISRILEESGIAPSLLVLEITESAFIADIKYTKTMLEELKNIGVSISIDDFGTGYSSLSYLKKFPVDNLKIDISFVREIAVDADAASIVSAIVTMANALNLKTIAEGIETEEQLKILHDLQCDAGQGFFFLKPVPPAALEEYWKSFSHQNT